MGETRNRPARERERFIQIIRANLWFYRRLIDVDDPSWNVIRDWEELCDSVKIRRWRAATPQESSDAGYDNAYPNATEEAEIAHETECNVAGPATLCAGPTQELMNEVMAPPLHPEMP